MKPRLGFAIVLAVAWLAAAPVAADVVFPARLDVVETGPGRYSITFTLPMIEGRVLRAMPSMPPTCRDLTEREQTATFRSVTTTWAVGCEPPSLAGEAIFVEGLLGTQIELAFSLTTLDGRAYNEILKPSRPGFLVPPPPSPAALAADAGMAGVRWVMRQIGLWLLVLVVGLAGVRAREVGWGVVAFATGTAAGQWLVAQGWLDVSRPVGDAFILLTAAVPAVRLAGGGERWQGWIQPLWPVMLLTGALVAGNGTAVISTEGLSRGEQLGSLGLFAAGTAFGVAWLALVAVELEMVLARASNGRRRADGSRVLGYALGALATGMLLARVVALALVARGFPPHALSLVVAALVLGPFLVIAFAGGRWTVPAFAALAVLGFVPGLARLNMPLGEVLVPALLGGAGLALGLARPPRPGWALAVAAAATVACAWSGTLVLVDNVSRSTAAAASTILSAIAVLYVVLALGRRLQPGASALTARAVGFGVVLWVAVGRLAAYQIWFEREVATSSALGLLRIPVAATALAVLAALLWPRRRRVLDELGVQRRRPVRHWFALAAAFLAVPYGTAAVRNPLYQVRAPRGDDARRIASSVLFDTYRAFNLNDEEEVFDRLADSVSGDLVEDLYLDSRRRLTEGTRAGTEVTVRDVSVLEIGEPTEERAGSGAFAYDCRWVVTSRVRHLQHIHHRQNIYGGVLTLTVEGDRWKIAGVELASEDRVVLRSQPI